ncbi:peptidylprolyl isomerase [Thalassoroseus pseudoceratinae]|uniref:peptidylprolyl isomerase n=1 Tax=Thalassoroseus pseudoceratinae TaxID=2713176 RepID=UPI001F0D8EED|nr:peptidylprolyl isomerase [Thalassoroseus pseudoceratinae]
MSRWTWFGVGLLGMIFGCSGEPEPQPEPAAPVAAGDGFRVKFETTKGDFVIKVRPEWAPRGAERFRELVENGFYDGVKFFRVIPDFMVQFGMSGDPEVSKKWAENTIPDDPVKTSNQRGTVTFAKTGMPNSRTTQIFINYVDNSRLDADGFAPFGVVVEGMDVVDSLNSQYGGAPSSFQPQIQAEGNEFLDQRFPGLDEVKKATIISEETVPPKTEEAKDTEAESNDKAETDSKTEEAPEEKSPEETE